MSKFWDPVRRNALRIDSRHGLLTYQKNNQKNNQKNTKRTTKKTPKEQPKITSERGAHSKLFARCTFFCSQTPTTKGRWIQTLFLYTVWQKLSAEIMQNVTSSIQTLFLYTVWAYPERIMTHPISLSLSLPLPLCLSLSLSLFSLFSLSLYLSAYLSIC